MKHKAHLSLLHHTIDYDYQVFEGSDERFPPYSGHEFLVTHSVIEHDYPEAFEQFLDLGLDADIANILAFGENRFDLISNHIEDPKRQAAFEVFDGLAEAGYWQMSE